MSRQHRRRSWSNQQLDDILRALPFPTPPLASYVYSSRDRFHPCCHKDKPVEVKPCSATKERSLRICTPLLYSFIHEATPGNRLGSLVACCEQTAKKTPASFVGKGPAFFFRAEAWAVRGFPANKKENRLVPSTLRFRKFPGKTEGVWCSIWKLASFPESEY